MNHEQALKELESVFLQKLDKLIDDDIVKGNPMLTKQAVLDIFYTNIMALGYNNGNKQKAIDDIYEMQSPLYGESVELMENIEARIDTTIENFPGLIQMFSYFHYKTQAGQDAGEIVEQIKKALED
ncbi:MAG: hypothetical protein JNK09_21850 [Prolixibacteraceae bacterium]|nr:hypothetical protein [Prolixibacteraceae bacterium]